MITQEQEITKEHLINREYTVLCNAHFLTERQKLRKKQIEQLLLSNTLAI